MAVAASDIVIYGSANMPEDNSGTAGGAIDTTVLVVPDSASLFNSLNDTIEIVSSNAGDTTQTLTVTGRNAAGSIITENIGANGTTVANGATTFDRILKLELSAACAGTLTVRKATGDTTIVAIPAGVETVRRPFYAATADVSGGSERKFSEKVFVKNTHGTLAALGMAISESADPSSKIDFAIEDAQNDTGTIANRLATPTEITGDGFSSSSKTIPSDDLGPGDAIGVWLRLTLAAGTSPATTTYTLAAAFSST